MLKIGNKTFTSRLLLGTGKYENYKIMQEALDASGCEVVTVAVRRINIKVPAGGCGAKRSLPAGGCGAKRSLPAGGSDRNKESLLDYIDKKRYTILPNTAGCYTAEEAIRTARLGREAGLSELVKLEVIGDEKTLLPDTEALLDATRVLVKEGFIVMPYTNDDPIIARKLVDAGAACVMPLAAPIGSGQGILNQLNIKFILDTVKVPVIVDAGVGTASDAAIAMELGCDGILMNTGIASSKDPVKMAKAMKLAVESGRLAYESGRMPKKPYASASSPTEGIIR